MSLVENEITQKNIERARANPELERLNETELKLIPSNPAAFQKLFKDEAIAIEQIYLSSPHDEASLRLRAAYTPNGINYSAALKSRGELLNGALKRTETPATLDKKTYNYYKRRGAYPVLRKLRAEPIPGVTVDFFNSPLLPVLVEAEHEDPEMRDYLVKVMEEMTGSSLENHSHNPLLENESIAYTLSGMEVPPEPEKLDAFVRRIVGELGARYAAGYDTIIVTIDGMSGAGKSTVLRGVEAGLAELFGEGQHAAFLSTDDYHHGKSTLEARYGVPYVNWDQEQTYDLPLLNRDITSLAEGAAVQKRHFDFDSQEPVIEGEVHRPARCIIVEGLHAGSPHLASSRHLHFSLPTSIATSLHRDVRRLMIDGRANEVFPTPESRLEYQLKTGIPTYLQLERPPRNSYSASSRPLADRAFILERLAALPTR